MDSFLDVIRCVFPERLFEIDSSSAKLLYVYDDSALHQTVMTEDDTRVQISFVVQNHRGALFHVCVDGGIIEFGLEDYVGDGQSHGRNDCLLYNENELLFIELKMNVNSTTPDKGRWNRYYDGMKQIEDFFLYFREKLQNSGHPLCSYYPLTSIHPIICMKNPPKSSAQRNNLKEKFRQNTDLKIETLTSYFFN